jgi:ribosomal protein S18 acetylase RimI-like enzyme
VSKQPYLITEAKITDSTLIANFWQTIDNEATKRPFGGDTDSKQQRARDIIAHAISSPTAHVLTAIDGDNIIGTITGHLYQRPVVKLSSVGVVYSLWVSPGYRKQGIGQSLLSAIEYKLTFMGAEAFQVGWDTENHYAAEWWQKRGYRAYETIASKCNPDTEI